jgi:NRAMP (natural resistance-associated macrophage protein)-like metal ion transporter
MNATKANGFAGRLGPGLITGAADDDPSGIATYSQAGSQFRFGLAWTLLLTTPLMIGIQMLSARIGWVTGEGLGANIAKMCPRWLTIGLVGLLVVANTINIAADIGAMGEAVRLLAGGHQVLYVLGFGALSVVAQVYFSYERTVRILKWLTLALFSYVAVILSVSVPWKQALLEAATPWAHFPKGVSMNEYASMVVAVLGTTISPYLFFWQASQEVEDNNRRPEAAELRTHPAYAAEHLSRIKQDTYVGMTFSNVIAICIVVATAVTLNEHGITTIQTSAQAAEALRPVAGEFAFAVFALGIIGTGMLARAGRLRRVCGQRSIRLEERPFPWLSRSPGLLPHHHRRDDAGHGDGRVRGRPDQGAGVERHRQRCHLGSHHGGHDVDWPVETAHGRADHFEAAPVLRMGGHRGHGRRSRVHASDKLLRAGAAYQGLFLIHQVVKIVP